MHAHSGRLSVVQVLIFFAIGVYGGFLQAGVGIFLLAALVLGPGYDVVRANAVKVAIVLALTFAALIVFQANGQILWVPGLVLGVGNMIGAWLGTQVAVQGDRLGAVVCDRGGSGVGGAVVGGVRVAEKRAGLRSAG